MGTDRFSVAMCVYGKDNPWWFEQAVDSILNQTAKPTEVVLVVDGPVPESLDIQIRSYEQMPEFTVIRLPENKGHGNARRIALNHCTNELVALMDADDLSVPGRFEKQLGLLGADPELAVVGGQIAEFVEDPEITVGIRSVPTTDKEIKTYLKTRCPMNQMTVMFRKTEILRAGGYLDWYCNEDYYLWNRMALADMKFANVPDILVNVRVGQEMYRRRGGWKYFCSEWKLQNYMLQNRIIPLPTYLVNVAKRVIVQLLLPNRLRGWIFQKFART